MSLSNCEDPFLSIVIPVYNRAGSLRACLETIFSQSWTRYEIIVVDDGSTDDISSVIRQYAPLGIRFLSNECNSGVGLTRNKGVRHSRGQWVAFLDSDSHLMPGALGQLFRTISECDDRVGVVYGKSEQIGKASSRSAAVAARSRRWTSHEFLARRHIEEGLPVTRREILLRFPFEENLHIKRECGSLVWFAIARAGYEFVWTAELVQRYEISADGLSGRRFLAQHPEEMVICNQKIIERFGNDLLRVNKARLVSLHQKTAFYCVMSGRRPCALNHIARARKLDPINLRTLLLMGVCRLGPRTARKLYPVIAVAAA